MPRTDSELIAFIAGGGGVTGDAEITPGYRAELTRLMAVFVDSELAGAAGFVEFINRAPGLRERAVAARIVTEKFENAERVLPLLSKFGVNPGLYVRSHAWSSRLDRDVDLGNRRVGSDKRLNVFHYPLEGWVDAVVMNLLMSKAAVLQLSELAHCSYGPLSDAMTGIVGREAYHAELADKGLHQAVERSGEKAAEAAIAFWYPRVAATFGRSESDATTRLRHYGLRRHDFTELLRQWKEKVGVSLAPLGLTPP